MLVVTVISNQVLVASSERWTGEVGDEERGERRDRGWGQGWREGGREGEEQRVIQRGERKTCKYSVTK